jgi:hypothetical protein
MRVPEGISAFLGLARCHIGDATCPVVPGFGAFPRRISGPILRPRLEAEARAGRRRVCPKGPLCTGVRPTWITTSRIMHFVDLGVVSTIPKNQWLTLKTIEMS